MTKLVYTCGCKIDFNGNHCCDALTVELCEQHQTEKERLENKGFERSSKWIKEHPTEAHIMAQKILDLFGSPLVTRDILP